MLGLSLGPAVLALIGLLASALAQTPVVLEGVAADVAAQRAKRLGVRDPAFVEAEAVRQGAPISSTGSRVLACGGAPMDLAPLVDDVLGELNYMNDGEALKRGLAALGQVPCATSLTDVSQLALYTGMAATLTGDVASATPLWVLARSIDPDLAWPAELGEEGRAQFEALDRTSVPIGTSMAAGITDIDGQGPSATAAVGWHLVTVGNTRLLVEVDRALTLTVPAAWSPGVDAPLPPLPEGAYLTLGQGPASWAGGPAPVARRGRPVWVGVGAGLLAAGAGMAVGGFAQASAADQARCDAVDRAAWDAADARWNRARWLYIGGWATAGVGAAVGVGGVVLPRGVQLQGRF